MSTIREDIKTIKNYLEICLKPEHRFSSLDFSCLGETLVIILCKMENQLEKINEKFDKEGK